LLVAAIVVLLLEVLERLTGLLSRGGRIVWRSSAKAAPVTTRTKAAPVPTPSPAPAAAAAGVKEEPVSEAPVPARTADVSGILQALDQVQRRRGSKK
jgi:hypothetical protein